MKGQSVAGGARDATGREKSSIAGTDGAEGIKQMAGDEVLFFVFDKEGLCTTATGEDFVLF